jgi:hypothetical protein
MRVTKFLAGLAALGLALALPVSVAEAAQTGNSAGKRAAGTLRVTWQDPGAGIDGFGDAVARSGQGVGATEVVGATDTDGYAGEAYIYVRGTSGWPTTPTVTLADPAATSGDGFGGTVAIAGNTIVVGSGYTDSDAGAAYIYVRGSSGWPTTPTATLNDPDNTANDRFGSSVAVSGKNIVVGAPSTDTTDSAAYVYVRATSGWPTTPTATLNDPVVTAGDSFGYSVAVSGKTIVVGRYSGQAAYVYMKGTAGWPSTPSTILTSPGPRDAYGYSVAVAGDTLVVGGASVDDGSAYVYVEGSSGWPTTPTVTLSDPATETNNNYFGYSVAVAGDTLAIGSPGYKELGPGAAYVYVRGTSGWLSTPTATLTAPAPTAGDHFGLSVALGTGVVVGAPGTNSGAGATYLFAS